MDNEKKCNGSESNENEVSQPYNLYMYLLTTPQKGEKFYKRYIDEDGNIYFVGPNKAGNKFGAFCINAQPKQSERKITPVKSCKYHESKDEAQDALELFASANGLSVYWSAEHKYYRGEQAKCKFCEYFAKGSRFSNDYHVYYDFLLKRNRKVILHKNKSYCFCPKMVDQTKYGKLPYCLNGHDIRRFDIYPGCPYNVYTHNCAYCGSRMATKDKMHKSCAKEWKNYGYIDDED